jgi:urease accessory protein
MLAATAERGDARPPMLMMVHPSSTPLPGFVRARGGVRLVVGATPGGSAALTIAESGGYRIRFPKGAACEGVLINTGGGMTGGDRMTVDAALLEDAEAVLTTQAAEKIYRSDGGDTEMAVSLALGRGSRLAWLPQEQILFDGGRFRRDLAVSMADDARLTLVESVVFGRWARGEEVSEGTFRDRWRIRRGGRLVLAEDVRLEGPIAAALARPAVGKGARAVATFLHVGPDAEAQVEAVRAMLDDASSECGVSAWDGILLARFLSPDPQALRSDLARFVTRFRGLPVPRSWQT